MFYRNHTSKNHSIQIVSLAAGLALATVAVIGGSEVLKENTSDSTTQVTPRVERIAPQFGSMADAASASQSITPATQFGTIADAAQAVDSLRPQTSSVVNNGEYLGIGQPAVGQSFATMADAAYASLPVISQEVASAVTTVEAQTFLGIGQPGESAESESPMFSTMADAAVASR